MVEVDPSAPSITLCSGETIYGDVVVGADGPNGVSRKYVIQEDDEEDLPGHLAMYKCVGLSLMYFYPRAEPFSGDSTTIPKRQIMNDPELATLYKQDLV